MDPILVNRFTARSPNRELALRFYPDQVLREVAKNVHTYDTALRRRITKLPENKRTFELIVVTHIDADHIDGSLILLQELPSLNVRINELWFNGWDQLTKPEGAREVYAPLQGEFLGGLITVDPALKRVWNRHFDSIKVFIDLFVHILGSI